MNTAEKYDLGLAWCWCYDDFFVNRLRYFCGIYEIKLWEFTSANLEDSIARLAANEFGIFCYFDRASDMDDYFLELNEIISQRGCYIVNRQADWAADKATMTLEFLSRGIRIPYTVILSPLAESRELIDFNAAAIKYPLVVKPASGGGGEGVHLNVHSRGEIQAFRGEFPDDKYLIQEKIIPAVINHKPAWFRPFYAFGEVMICLQDDVAGRHYLITQAEIGSELYARISEQTHRIAEVCGLDLFSTEIALTNAGELIAIDHVNDQCDYRVFPDHSDGIPKEIVDFVCDRFARFVKNLSDKCAC